MKARIRQLWEDLTQSFWLLPSLIVLAGVTLAEILIGAERRLEGTPDFMSRWIYNGGETGARTLLGAVAGSTIAVAGTVFSITIATLTLASNQMGPRLLNNFTRDRGNQATLGIYLGTFAYTLIVLRAVRGADQGAFVPHLAITGAIALALLCVGMLIFFVNHVSNRINFDTVIHLVSRDLREALDAVLAEDEPPPPPPREHWQQGEALVDRREGYIQQLDDAAIADWAARHNTVVRLRARTGHFVFPGAPLAVVSPPVGGASEMLRKAIVIGPYPTGTNNIEFAVGQLVDIAVRALSSGVNDPRTALRVLDRMAAALCTIAGRHLPNGVIAREGRTLLHREATSYDGLLDAMFHVIRQSAAGAPAVLIHMVESLARAAECEGAPRRLAALARHGELLAADGRQTIVNLRDRQNFLDRIAEFRLLLARRRGHDGATAQAATAGQM